MPKRRREDCSPPPTPSSPSLATDISSSTSVDEPVHSSKYIQTSRERPTKAVMKCSLPPHELIEFSTFEEFESHYASDHAHRCSDCRHNFPSEHFLQLHISENHDPLSEAKRAKGEKTVCLSPFHCTKGSLMSPSISVLWKVVTKSALLRTSDVCISQTSICSQEQATFPIFRNSYLSD